MGNKANIKTRNTLHQQSTNHRGSAGGSASTGGAQFAASVASWCAVKMLLGEGASIPWDTLENASIVRINCENPTEVDDLVLTLLPVGTVYIQIKHGLQLGSEFRKAIGQLVRQFRTQEFSTSKDRLAIVTDYSASGTVRSGMCKVLERCRNLPRTVGLESCKKSKETTIAFEQLRDIFYSEWMKDAGKKPTNIEFRNFLNSTYITVLDPLSPYETSNCIEHLGRVTHEGMSTEAWCLLNQKCLDLAVIRKPLDRPSIWSYFTHAGIQCSVRRFNVGSVEADIAEVIRNMTTNVLTERVRLGLYNENLIVQRSSLNELFQKFQDSHAKLMIVSGESGRGKSTWTFSKSAEITVAPILLVRGEMLNPLDNGLLGTVRRLLKYHVSQEGGELPRDFELNEWLNHSRLIVLVDGLDRAIEFTRCLKNWLEVTLAELSTTNIKVVITTRPETVAGASSLFDLSPQVFQPEKGTKIICLDEYNEFEAMEAANRLNAPWLSKYRHPSMMAFCAKLSEHGSAKLSHSEVTRRYFERCLDDIQLESGVLREQLNQFVDILSMALARSPDGLQVHSDLNFADASYEALRRASFLIVVGNSVRIESDEVSEYLQGRYINVAESINELTEYLQYPLKIGALRSAVIQMSIKSPQQAIAHLGRVVDFLERHREKDAFSLVCSVIEELHVEDDLYSLLLRVAKVWRQSNLFSSHGVGHDLLELISDPRWSVLQRLELLWALGIREDGFDWRTKHWLTPDKCSHNFVTPWRKAMLSILKDSGELGLKFLLPHLDSHSSLMGSSEANMGHLAQGLFYLTSAEQVNEAMNLLASCDTEGCRRLRGYFAIGHSVQVARWIADAAAQRMLSDESLVELMGTVSEDSSALGSASDTARKIMVLCKEGPLYRSCLQTLSAAGDACAAAELVEQSNLTLRDISTCIGHAGRNFETLVTRVLQRAALGEVNSFELGGLAIGEFSESQAVTLAKILATWIGVDRLRAESAAHIVEALVRCATYLEETPPAISVLFDQQLAVKSSIADRCLIYCCTGHDTDTQLSEAGRCFRKVLIERLIERVTDEHDLLLLAENIVTRPAYSAYAAQFLRKLHAEHPNIKFQEQLKILDYFPGVEAVLADVFASK